jgi:hypothetical protein
LRPIRRQLVQVGSCWRCSRSFCFVSLSSAGRRPVGMKKGCDATVASRLGRLRVVMRPSRLRSPDALHRHARVRVSCSCHRRSAHLHGSCRLPRVAVVLVHRPRLLDLSWTSSRFAASSLLSCVAVFVATTHACSQPQKFSASGRGTGCDALGLSHQNTQKGRFGGKVRRALHSTQRDKKVSQECVLPEPSTRRSVSPPNDGKRNTARVGLKPNE